MIKKLLKIADLFLGLFVSSIFAYTINQIAIIYLGNSGFERISWVATALAWIIFAALFFAWIKAKKFIFKAGIILAFVAAYLLGRIYATNTYQSVNEAFTLYKEAYFSSGMAMVTSSTDNAKYLEAYRKYVLLVKVASEKPKGSLQDARRFYNEIYLKAQEALDYDEKTSSGQLILTEEENNKMGNKLLAERDEIFQKGYVDPSWVSYFWIR